jgi:hypothetical protein
MEKMGEKSAYRVPADGPLIFDPEHYPEDAAQRDTCARCGKTIKTVTPESTPAGSMHPRCARAYEREKPEDW